MEIKKSPLEYFPGGVEILGCFASIGALLRDVSLDPWIGGVLLN